MTVYVVLILIASAFPVFATGAGETEEPPLEALIVGHRSEPTTLDPHARPAADDLHVLNHLYEGLVRFQDDSLSVEPALARSWEVSADGLTYTFYLRTGVTFHDGTPFNADAVRFNVERMIAGNHRLFGTGPLSLPFSDSGLTGRAFSTNTPFSFLFRRRFRRFSHSSRLRRGSSYRRRLFVDTVQPTDEIPPEPVRFALSNGIGTGRLRCPPSIGIGGLERAPRSL